MRSPTDVRGPGHRARLLLAAGLLAVAVLSLATPAAFAASTFTGGPIPGDYPLYVANDGTISALRFEATGGELAPSTQYYVKFRLSTAPSPSGSGNRGFTWNDDNATPPAVQGSWVQEREDWTLFPTVTTDASGHIAASDRWFFFRLSDTTKSGTYYILVSLQPVGAGAGTTFNSWRPAPESPAQVTVVDMAGAIPASTAGFWVHNGAATGFAEKRAEADAGGVADVWALSRTEPNGVDDDGDGVVDDEDTGPAGTSGDFRLAVPVSQAFDVRLQNTVWPDLATSLTGSLADVDIALGAADQTPPAAPGDVTAKAFNGHAVLTWSPVEDAGGDVTYVIYRWQDAVPLGGATQYTPQPLAVATTKVTNYDATSLANGQAYYFLVRAVDPATNVGQRSATVTVIPDGTAPAAVTGFTATAGDASVALSWTNPADADLAGVRVLRKAGMAPNGPDDPTAAVVFDGVGAAATDAGLTNGTRYFYTAYAYDSAGNHAAAASADATPRTASSLTVTAAAKVVKYLGTTTLGGVLEDAAGTPLADRLVSVWSSTNGTDWDSVATVSSGTGTFQVTTPAIATATQFRVSWPGDATTLAKTSEPVTVTPKVGLGAPVAPSTARKGRSFSVYGSLRPHFTAGVKTVKLQCYRRSSNGTWVLKATVAAKNVDYSSFTRYRALLTLSSAGKWRIRAFVPASGGFATTTSGFDYLTVK